MTCKVRFAPSPTGLLHIGNARIAVVNYLFAKKNDGIFLLRIDDTDTARSKIEYETAIIEDLAWLGIKHDEFFRQSERLARYMEVLKQLIEKGLVYKCYETQEELDYKRKRALARGLAPVYDRAALSLSEAEKQRLENECAGHYWRFRLPDTVATWCDVVLGDISYDLKSISDPVIMKADGTFLYTFTSIIDDIDSRITHIIRGQDHVTNTAAQIAMFEAIGGDRPEFAHLSLLVSKDGSQFSKRLGSTNLRDIRRAGIDPMSVSNVLATLGTSLDVAQFLSMDELAEYFDIAKFSTNSPKFDIDCIAMLNKKIMHKLTYDDVKIRLGDEFTMQPDMFEVIKENVENYEDIKKWIEILDPGFVANVQFSGDEGIILNIAADIVAAGTEDLLERIKTASGASGRALYVPIRKALTGMEHGPNLNELLAVFEDAEIIRRINMCSR